MFVPFAEFAPDKPPLGLVGMQLNTTNVVPLTEKSYGRVSDFAALTGGIGARCQGAISVRSSDGTIHSFAGDATKLYKLNADGVTWDDVSRAAGYTTSADQRWYFIQMGDRIVATNYTDEIQTYVLGTSTLFANLAAAAPKARFIAVIKGFLVAADTWDAADGYKQSRVWWADHDDPTNWPTPGTAAAAAAQSDFQDIQFGGGINGLVGGCGGRDGVIFLQNAIVVMDYVGGGVVFAFADAERGRGTTIPSSVINVGLFAGYIGEDGFALFDGAKSILIGANKVDRYFWDNVDQTALHLICTAYNSSKKLIYWAIKRTSDSANTIPTQFIFNWELGRWGYAQTTAIQFMFGTFTAGYTLETLDNVSADLETLPYSLDSQAWMGGRALLAGFNSVFKFGYFDGSTLTATLRTGTITGNNGKRLFCRGFRAVIESDNTWQGTIVYGDDQRGDTGSITTAAVPGSDGYYRSRATGRYLAFQAVVSDSDWTHAQGVEVDVTEGGLR